MAFFAGARAQQFGGNPPSLKWEQVNTDTARIIFPAGLEKQAREISTIIHKLSSLTLSTIGDRIRKINVVLQPLPTEANGYVSLGPFRSEFFLTPQQNSFELGSLPWHKTLALHEFRHVQQYSNFRNGLSKAFYIVFGEEGQALANSLVIPDWFYEGDAVYQETLMSNQGRGRLPFFFNDYRSLWASGKKYSWLKLRNGSYQDLVPNHYQLGYMLTAYGYEIYGEEIWKKITADASAFNGLFYPFQKAVKKYTGVKYSQFTKDAIQYFKQQNKIASEDSVALYGRNHVHFDANEEYPAWTDNHHILYVKSDFKHIPAFYEKNVATGKEKKIKVKSISADNYFSYNNGRIVYSASEPDARWGWKNYEVINVIDVNSGEEKKVTRHTRYLSPDISIDGKAIVAVNSEITGTNHLDVLDAATGKITAVVPNKRQFIFTYPKFFNSTKIISAVRNVNGEMALGKFDIATGDAEWLTPFSLNAIAFPQVNGDTISFSMTENSHDKLFIAVGKNVFRFDPDNENSSTGNYQLTTANGHYAWSSFTAAGYHLFSGNGTLTENLQADKKENNFYPLHRLQSPLNILSDTTVTNYPVTKYSQTFHLFNFHSWRPYFSDPDYSYSLIGQNILNTFQSELYVSYNRNEKFKETGAIFSYGGWYPVLTAGGSFTFDRSFTDTARKIQWNELSATAGVRLPLSFASGTFYQNLNIGASINTKQVYYTGASKELFPDKRFNYAEYVFSASNQQLKARQNIYPRLAQTILARYRHIVNNYTAHQLLLNAAIYLPGFSRNHSIVVQAAYQHRDTLQQYNFTNSFPFSRGYSDVDFPRMWKIGGNYHFPIAYPDAGFANIIYLLRLRGNAFYDYSKIKSVRTGRTLPLRTVGGELYFDTKWWNQLALSIGFRYSRLLDNEVVGLAPNQYEIVLPVNLLSR